MQKSSMDFWLVMTLTVFFRQELNVEGALPKGGESRGS